MISVTSSHNSTLLPALYYRTMAESEPGASAEGRININDVPEQISRIFFGQGSSRPHYTDDSYGVPGLSVPGFGLSPGPLLYRGEAVRSVRSCHHSDSYSGYVDDIVLLVKLGQAALIIFMVFVIIAILFMIITCCMSLVNITGNKRQNEIHPQPFSLSSLVIP